MHYKRRETNFTRIGINMASSLVASSSRSRSALESFFTPASVAVIGATEREGSVGRTILENLVHSSYHGQVFAVNPKRSELLGIRCYPSVAALPEPVDLAVIVTPAATVPGVVRECVDAGTRSAIVISAGFKERGAEGVELERLVQAELRRGSMLDVNWGDLISFYGEDPQTKSILLYIESIADARSFLSAAREVALSKPIIVIKAGRTEAASQAASSHTGAMTGSDDVFDAALRRCGVLRVQSISDLFYMAEVLSKQPRPRGPRLTIVTNAGGPGVLATDALIPNGGELTPLSQDSLSSLSGFLPSHWSHANPIDILGDADPELYEKAVKIAIADPSSDGLLVVLAPQGMTNPAEVARRLAPYAQGQGKPVLASWMGGQTVAEGEAILNAAGIPTFSYPDTAARAFDYMWSYSSHLRALYETPAMTASGTDSETRFRKAKKLIDRTLGSGRTLLTEVESKELLSLYGIPSVPTRVARTADEAAAHAAEFGYPAVLKVYSKTITHKTDVGGVKLDLPNAAAVRRAFRSIQSSVRSKAGEKAFQGVTVQPMIRLDGYELILGSNVDPVFGPVILFGSGGQLVEVYRPRLGLAALEHDAGAKADGTHQN